MRDKQVSIQIVLEPRLMTKLRRTGLPGQSGCAALAFDPRQSRARWNNPLNQLALGKQTRRIGQNQRLRGLQAGIGRLEDHGVVAGASGVR